MSSKIESSGLSIISEERSSARKHHEGNEDMDSVYNHKVKNGHGSTHKKKLHPLLLGPSRQNPGRIISLHAASKNNLSEFTQRIMSAKLLRVKQVQNQLNETQIQLNELINENRILRNLQKRQEGALRRYEGNHAELPQLIRSHNEEIRALKANNKLIKAQLKESNAKLKERESELEALRDNYNKLKKLSLEKNLLEREKLQKKVEELQEVIKEQEEKIQVLSRKVLLESKNYRHHLNIEVSKHKETQKDLNSALSMISKLESQLIAKEKLLPGGKVLLKRDSKNLMPVIMNKTEIQPKIGVSEDSFLSHEDEKRKSHNSDSIDSELELLNCVSSSGDTTSPMQDIFPDINKSNKRSPELKKTTEIINAKSELFQSNYEVAAKSLSSLKCRKTSLSKEKPPFSTDIDRSAKVVAEKLNEDMEAIANLAKKVHETTIHSTNLNDINSLFNEVKANATKIELEVKNQFQKNNESAREENYKNKNSEERRSVPKRKLEEEKQSEMFETESSDFDLKDELMPSQQQKLENMSRTWNDIKSKIQEERKKAEEKIKELNKINGSLSHSNSSSDAESEKDDEFIPDSETVEEPKKELSFVNITDDAYILRELEKTDKIFNKLKNKKQKSGQPANSFSPSPADNKIKPNVTSKPSPKHQEQDVKSFRTKSQREPKYLEQFQSEFEKQNLLKALRKIDVGKDPNVLSEESEESETETNNGRVAARNGLKSVHKFSSSIPNKETISELLASKRTMESAESLKLGFERVAGVNQ